jgi:hypothetical protein
MISFPFPWPLCPQALPHFRGWFVEKKAVSVTKFKNQLHKLGHFLLCCLSQTSMYKKTILANLYVIVSDK